MNEATNVAFKEHNENLKVQTKGFDKIWLIQQPTISRQGQQPNLQPALDLLSPDGEIVTLVEGGIYASKSPMGVRELIMNRLAGEAIEAEKTAFLWAGGDTLLPILLGVVLADLSADEFTWLKYERIKDDNHRPIPGQFYYRPIRVNLEELYGG